MIEHKCSIYSLNTKVFRLFKMLDTKYTVSLRAFQLAYDLIEIQSLTGRFSFEANYELAHYGNSFLRD